MTWVVEYTSRAPSAVCFRIPVLHGLLIIIIKCFIRCWQNAAKYNHEVGLIYIKVDKTIHANEIKCNLDDVTQFTN